MKEFNEQMADIFYIVEIGSLRLHVLKGAWDDMTDVQRNEWLSTM